MHDPVAAQRRVAEAAADGWMGRVSVLLVNGRVSVIRGSFVAGRSLGVVGRALKVIRSLGVIGGSFVNERSLIAGRSLGSDRFLIVRAVATGGSLARGVLMTIFAGRGVGVGRGLIIKATVLGGVLMNGRSLVVGAMVLGRSLVGRRILITRDVIGSQAWMR